MSLGTDLRFLFQLDRPILIWFDRTLDAYRITLHSSLTRGAGR